MDWRVADYGYGLPVAGTPVPPVLVEAAMMDASRLSGLPMVRLPHAAIMTPWQMILTMGSDGALGAYNWATHEIVLRGPWDKADPENWSTLVHEAVHALQSGVHGHKPLHIPFETQAAERQAYAVQYLLLREMGHEKLFLCGDDESLREGALSLMFRCTGVHWATDTQIARNMRFAHDPQWPDWDQRLNAERRDAVAKLPR